MPFTKEQELQARREAVSGGHDPDEIVATNSFDQDHNSREMPIWEAIAHSNEDRRYQMVEPTSTGPKV